MSGICKVPIRISITELKGYSYFGARYYLPELSVWLSIDPLADKAPGWTPYRYGFNNPIMFVDPSGLLEGDIFNLKGEKIGTDGVADKAVYLLYTRSNENISVEDAKTMTSNLNSGQSGSNCVKDLDFKKLPITTDELNTNAMLMTIRESEGHGKPLDYNALYGGGTFSDFSKHPNQKITKWGKTSSAAGAYQFLKGTWDAHSQKLGLVDFSAASQDKAAVYEMSLVSGALPKVQAGDYNGAFLMLNGKWTSLPGGRHQWKPSLDSQYLRNRANVLRQLGN